MELSPGDLQERLEVAGKISPKSRAVSELSRHHEVVVGLNELLGPTPRLVRALMHRHASCIRDCVTLTRSNMKSRSDGSPIS